MRRKKEKELTCEWAFGERTTLKVTALVSQQADRIQGQADESEGQVDESEGDELSISRINKVEIEEWGKGCALYMGEKCTKDEVTPSSRSEANENAPRVRALNEWRLEESPINDFPTPLDQKIVNQ